MARIVNEAAHAARRNAILDATQRVIETKGYEQMAISDILSELQMSSGAFYHYFNSKPALLEALVERMGDQTEQLIRSIALDRKLGALDKLKRFFISIDRKKLAHKRLVFAFIRVWYADENAIVRNKLYLDRVKRLAPWLEKIIWQGIEEGIFQTPYPDQAARAILALQEDIGYAAAGLLLAEEHTPDDLSHLQRIIVACCDSLERVLGAPTGCLQSAMPDNLSQWLIPPSQQQ